MAELPAGTVTFLFTGIEGSTELLRRIGDARYAELLAECRRALAGACARGRQVNAEGDALLFVFDRARDAVTAAVSARHLVGSAPLTAGGGFFSDLPAAGSPAVDGEGARSNAQAALG